MKKTVQINLGGVPFTIDDDAYRRLDSYMLDLERYFAHSGNQDDIMTDIESRIAELFTEMLKARTIVEITDVEATIRIMGTPSDFEGSGEATSPDGKPWDIKTGKKLFRNTDDKVIGGVCSGLAAYFGIEEVLWVRLAFVIVFLTAGFGVVVYLVLWALVPEAKTAADRLAMMGEPANVKNIAHMVERGIEDLSTTIKHNWKRWQSKKKSDGDAEDASFRGPGRGRVLLAALLVPVFLAAKIGSFMIHLVRRIFHSRSMHYNHQRFV